MMMVKISESRYVRSTGGLEAKKWWGGASGLLYLLGGGQSRKKNERSNGTEIALASMTFFYMIRAKQYWNSSFSSASTE